MTTTEIGANICITNELAQTAATIAKQHPDCAIEIRWFEKLDTREWVVTATDGVNDHVYLCDDESHSNYVRAGNELLLWLDYPHPAIDAQKGRS